MQTILILCKKKDYGNDKNGIHGAFSGKVTTLQKNHPQTPVLLVEHSGGGNDHLLDTARNKEFKTSSQILIKVYNELKAKGIKNIHLLTTKNINMSIESTVDGTHPNDIGMMEHALAFEKKFREIFK